MSTTAEREALIDAARESFEGWAKTRQLSLDGGKNYSDDRTQVAWYAWQAASAHFAAGFARDALSQPSEPQAEKQGSE